MCFSPKALKVLRTSEFLPYVVFIEAPDFEVLKAMNRSAIESGVVTKQLTVSVCSLIYHLLWQISSYIKSLLSKFDFMWSSAASLILILGWNDG